MGSVEALIEQVRVTTNSGAILVVLKQSDELLHSLSAQQLLPFLEQLDPCKHTLPYLYSLEAVTSNQVERNQTSGLITIISKFIKACLAEHIRLVPEKFLSVCQKFKDFILVVNDPLRGVGPLMIAIEKVRISKEHLTAIHPDFLQLCLLAKCYRTGLRILNEDDIYEVGQPRDFFLYCYYGGMICIGQKQFKKALELLHNVATAPMPVVNAIAAEAYKKFVLISLVHNGQFSSSLPKYASAAAQRNMKTLCQVYYDLAVVYGNGRILDTETFVRTHWEKFEADNNIGLVKQAMASMYRRNIQRLTQTYLTLSLQDIATTVHLNSAKEAELHVLQMIQDGEIFATINQKDGMVQFMEDPEQYKSSKMIEHIDSSIKRISTLSKKLGTMDKLIACDPVYLSKVGKERQRFDFDDFDSVPQRFHM